MIKISQFSVSPLSRHPKHFPLAYNKVSHKYSENYINPQKWDIRISLDLALERDRVKLEADRIPPLSNSPIFNNLRERKEKLLKQLKAINAVLNAHEIRFNIKNIDGSFSEDTAKNDYHTIIEVPAVGTYIVTLKVKNQNGQVSNFTQNTTFRDILIVSLGDSYAAGEGNPDERGTPTKPMESYANRNIITRKLAQIILDTKKIGPNGTIPNVSPELHFANWQEPLAHRSYKSGHSIGAMQLEGKVENLHVVTTFLPFSRSGATIEGGLIGPNVLKYHPERRLFLGSLPILGEREEVAPFGSLDFKLKIGQLDEAKNAIKNRRVDFLVMTIGGNNVKWTENFPLLVTKDIETSWESYISNPEAGEAGNRRELILKTAELLETLPQKFEQLNTKIRQTLNPKFVLITDYPNGFFGDKNYLGNTITKSECDIFETIFDADVDHQDANVIRDLAKFLNFAIKKAASKHGWIFVDGIDDDFKQHGYCSADSFLVRASESFLTQGDWYGMLHPNEKGCAAYGRRIATAIKKIIQEDLGSLTPVGNDDLSIHF